MIRTLKQNIRYGIRNIKKHEPEFSCLFSLVLTFCLCFLSSCSSDNDVWEDVEQQRIIVLFSPGGLGDNGYNDQILRGLQRVHNSRDDVQIQFYSPSSIDTAERIFDDWLNAESLGTPELFILASPDYEDMAVSYLSDGKYDTSLKNILLFETTNNHGLPLYSFQISMYGASYLSGVAAATMGTRTPLIVLSNDADQVISYAADGFRDGYTSVFDCAIATKYLSNDWHGYVMAENAYMNMFEWAKEYDFIFPVSGGSNLGIYRYLREYPKGIFTAGMDVDQSTLCSSLVGSVVKHTDVMIEHYVTAWLDDLPLEPNLIYGLESGYVDWLLAPDYKEVLETVVKEYRQEAIKKEHEYNANL